MGQASGVLRRVQGGYSHWCPGCEEMHILPDSWQFDGNLESPTFKPSFKHEGVRKEFNKYGNWTGEWIRDEHNNVIHRTCHYVLTAGVLNFCADCTHALVGKSVPMPPLPEGLTD